MRHQAVLADLGVSLADIAAGRFNPVDFDFFRNNRAQRILGYLNFSQGVPEQSKVQLMDSLKAFVWDDSFLQRFADFMLKFGKNPQKGLEFPDVTGFYEKVKQLTKAGGLPENTLERLNEFFKKECIQYNIIGKAQAAALSIGMQLFLLFTGFVIADAALVHLSPEGFWDPEDNALLPLDISDEELQRHKQYKRNEKIRNNIPFCQFNEGLDKCLPTANSNHDDESKCYVKDGQCKVNKGWIKSAYNWWNGNDTDTQLFYKNQEDALVPLTEETYHRHLALYNQDGSPFREGWLCPICLEDTDSPVVWTRSGIMDRHGHDSCGHKYHTTCINQMIQLNRIRGQEARCPKCRQLIILPHYTERPNPHHEGRKKSNRLRKSTRRLHKSPRRLLK